MMMLMVSMPIMLLLPSLLPFAVTITVFALVVLVGILLLLLLLLLFLLPLPANHRCCHFRFRLMAMRLIVLTWSKWLQFVGDCYNNCSLFAAVLSSSSASYVFWVSM